MSRHRFAGVPASLRDRPSGTRAQAGATIAAVVLLMSGQGFRFLLGIPLYVACVVAVVATMVWAFRGTLRQARPPLMIAAFGLLAAASIAWSATRGITALAVVVLATTTLLAILAVRGTTAVEFMARWYRGLQISLGLGVAFELVVATVVRRPVRPLMGDLLALGEGTGGLGDLMWSHNLLAEGGPVQGFVGNRNPFGAIALWAAIGAVLLLLERRIHWFDAYATVAVALGVHLLTRSATVTTAALYLVGLALAAVAIRRTPRRLKRVVSFAVLTVTAVVAILTLKYRDAVFGLFDRGADVSLRTDLWDAVIEAALARPEGWGFVSYWPVWREPYAGIVETSGVSATHAHNAFLDAWLQLGIVGLALLLVIITLEFGSAWRLVERAHRGDTYLPLGWAMLTAAMALQALTESRMLVEGGWFLLVALYCMSPQVFALTIVDPVLVHTGSGTTKSPRYVPRSRRGREADEPQLPA